MFRRPFSSLLVVRHGLTALLLGMAGSVAAAPAPPTPMPAIMNDGYVTVSFINGQSHSFSARDKVCRVGTGLKAPFWSGPCTCDDGEPLVSVQEMLDLKFGKGQAQAVGYAPNGGWVTVFYRFVTPSR